MDDIKRKILKEIIDLMDEKIVDGLKKRLKPEEEIQKVEVMSDDKDGLEEGLDKAKEIISKPDEVLEGSSEEDLERLKELYEMLK